MRTSSVVTFVALLISFGWGFLLGVFVLSGTRENVWYDMDFSLWMVCVLYAFVHLLVGKILALAITPLIGLLHRKTIHNFEPQWTEDTQLVFSSLWPVSVPLSVLFFIFLMLFGRKKPGKV